MVCRFGQLQSRCFSLLASAYHEGFYEHVIVKFIIKIYRSIDLNNINIHAIFSRTKEIESYSEKIKDPRYTNPIEQITDLSGIRVICYVESDIEKICNVIESNFKIDKPNSSDKSKLLGTDKVGYKSVHYVAKLKDQRLKLPEYKKFSECMFEIQVRTILQHAWAEIEHDREYKFSGELPADIQRRFKLLSGALEIVDKQFDDIANEIDKINFDVTKGIKEGKLEFDINTTTLKQYLITKFEPLVPSRISPTFPSPKSEIQILEELKDFGLKNLDDLNKIIPPDYLKVIQGSNDIPTNFIGLLRNIMISVDWNKYFEKAYKNDWSVFSLNIRKDILTHYKVPIESIESKYPKKQSKSK